MANQKHHKITWMFTILDFRTRSKRGVKIDHYIISKRTAVQRRASNNRLQKLCMGLALILKYLLLLLLLFSYH